MFESALEGNQLARDHLTSEDDPISSSWFVHLFIQDYVSLKTGFRIEVLVSKLSKNKYAKQLKELKNELEEDTF